MIFHMMYFVVVIKKKKNKTHYFSRTNNRISRCFYKKNKKFLFLFFLQFYIYLFMSTTTPQEDIRVYSWIPKFETKKTDRYYEWRVYIPGASERSLDMSLEFDKKVILLTGYKEANVTDKIYQKIYDIPIPEGHFKLEIPFPPEELDFDNFRINSESCTLILTIPLKSAPPTKKILLKKGTLSI